MRLDKYLKVSRIIKRRTVANEACDAGRILVNGKPARASYDVKVGDTLEIGVGKPMKVEVDRRRQADEGGGRLGQRVRHQGERGGDV